MMSLSDHIITEVWGTLNKRRWFGKHVEEDEIDELYEELLSVVKRTIRERIL